MGGAAIEGFELGVIPEEFRDVEDFGVEVDEAPFDEKFTEFL